MSIRTLTQDKANALARQILLEVSEPAKRVRTQIAGVDRRKESTAPVSIADTEQVLDAISGALQALAGIETFASTKSSSTSS